MSVEEICLSSARRTINLGRPRVIIQWRRERGEIRPLWLDYVKWKPIIAMIHPEIGSGIRKVDGIVKRIQSRPRPDDRIGRDLA
jgi:hypothetical protein